MTYKLLLQAPWDIVTAVNVCGQTQTLTGKNTMWAQRDFACDDAQDKDDCRQRIKGQLANPGLPGKWPLKRSVCVCVLFFCNDWWHCNQRCWVRAVYTNPA